MSDDACRPPVYREPAFPFTLTGPGGEHYGAVPGQARGEPGVLLMLLYLPMAARGRAAFRSFETVPLRRVRARTWTTRRGSADAGPLYTAGARQAYAELARRAARDAARAGRPSVTTRLANLARRALAAVPSSRTR